MDEKKLVERSLQGDNSAFGELVERYRKKVFNMAYSITRDPETADDLAQDVFIKALSSLNRFKFEASFGTWLYRISLNHITDHLRQEKRKQSLHFKEALNTTLYREDDTLNRERSIMKEQQKTIVREGIKKLPEKYRIILSLRDIQGLPYKEIAQILNISPGTVDSRLFRARKMLRKKISPFLFTKGEGYEMS
jgi:RNA polymerase sigma-70 factor (ECF subfamily)